MIIGWFKKLIARARLELAYRKNVRDAKDEDPYIYK
jgi:hypothetical protein